MFAVRPAWYLKEWLDHLGKTQQWVADELGLQKSEVSRKATGRTPYTSTDAAMVARLLGLETWELLMHPSEAEEIHFLRGQIDKAAERRMTFRPPPPERPSPDGQPPRLTPPSPKKPKPRGKKD